MLSVHDDDEGIDVRVVEDALAFVDAFYSSADDVSEASPTETDGESDAVDNLNAALDDVYDKLVALNSHAARETTDLLHTQLVAGTYGNCGIHQRLDTCRRLWQLLQRPWTRWLAPLEDVAVVGLLQGRLDEITTRVASGESERPLLEQRPSLEDVSAKYFDHTQIGIGMRFRSGRFIPFKLSILAKAIWSVVLDGSFSRAGHSLAVNFEHLDEILARFRDDMNEADGVIALRRSPLPDGSVLLCWTTVSAAPHAEVYHVENIVGDMEIHQLGWIRVGRVIHGTCPASRAYLEGVTDCVVRPAFGARERDQELNRQRCERFKAASYAVAYTDTRDKRQLLENRMLDATVGTFTRNGGQR